MGANKQQLEIPLDVVADIPTKVDASVSWMPARGGSFSLLKDPIWDQWIINGFPMGFCKMRLLKYWRFLNDIFLWIMTCRYFLVEVYFCCMGYSF